MGNGAESQSLLVSIDQGDEGHNPQVGLEVEAQSGADHTTQAPRGAHSGTSGGKET